MLSLPRLLVKPKTLLTRNSISQQKGVYTSNHKKREEELPQKSCLDTLDKKVILSFLLVKTKIASINPFHKGLKSFPKLLPKQRNNFSIAHGISTPSTTKTTQVIFLMNWAAKTLYIDFIKKTSSLVSIKKLVIHPLICQF